MVREGFEKGNAYRSVWGDAEMGRCGDGEMVREGFEKGNAYRTVFGIRDILVG